MAPSIIDDTWSWQKTRPKKYIQKDGYHVGKQQWITDPIARPASLGRDPELQAATVVGPDGQTDIRQICIKISWVVNEHDFSGPPKCISLTLWSWPIYQQINI